MKQVVKVFVASEKHVRGRVIEWQSGPRLKVGPSPGGCKTLPMARILWHNTMSVDGFVALPGDEMSWMAPFVGPNETVQKVLPLIGAILMGGRTYRGVLASEAARPYGGAIQVPYLVLTRGDPGSAPPGFQFLNGSMARVASSARDIAGDRYVAALGQQAGRALLEAGELDEILIHLAPVTLGQGVPMFAGGSCRSQLKLREARQSRRVIDLWFDVQR